MKLLFPFGRAPLFILLAAIASGITLWVGQKERAQPPDLVLLTASPTHVAAYEKIVPAFEREHGVRVQVHLVNWQALKGRLRNALLAERHVADLVELQAGALGTFTSGPIDDVGFLDLSSRVREEGLDDKLVPSRLALWTIEGKTLALPHDVHPVMLAYRRDILQEAGIDPETLRTWDDVVALAPKLMKDLDGDGIVDRHLFDFSAPPLDLRRLLAQQDADIIGPERQLRLDTPAVANTIAWYVKQTVGPHKTAYAAGWGQTYSRALIEGLSVFYLMADWRTKMLEGDVPGLAGQMALMPLPAWHEGGRRTSSEGGTGLAITRTSKRADLAWKLARHLYFNEADLGARFLDTNILPPTPKVWDQSAFFAPNAYFSGQPLGRFLAGLASEAPVLATSPFESLAEAKLDEVYRRAAARYAEGGKDLLPFIRAELTRVAGQVALAMRRNRLVAAEGDKP